MLKNRDLDMEASKEVLHVEEVAQEKVTRRAFNFTIQNGGHSRAIGYRCSEFEPQARSTEGACTESRSFFNIRAGNIHVADDKTFSFLYKWSIFKRETADIKTFCLSYKCYCCNNFLCNYFVG